MFYDVSIFGLNPKSLNIQEFVIEFLLFM